ncbi:MAG: hypothetical protein CMO55_18115 [Verrucomicrobiales bacterium]|nr:hypothetical protein [Verrucomicrobiales bacterium]
MKARTLIICIFVPVVTGAGAVLLFHLNKGGSAEQTRFTSGQAAEMVEIASVDPVQEPSSDHGPDTDVKAAMIDGERTEKDIAVDIIQLFGENNHPKIEDRVRRVRVSELLEEIYLTHRRRTIAGRPLVPSVATQKLSPDMQVLMQTLTEVENRDPGAIHELEMKIEEYGLKMGCESVEQVFVTWLSET